MPGWAVTLLVTISSSLIVAAIIGGFHAVKKYIKKVLEDNQLIKSAIQAVLRNNLYELSGKCFRKKHASITERMNFDNMYNIYHHLGHNGVMDDTYKKFMDLPVKENEEIQNNKHKH